MTLDEYKTALAKHNWYYQFSDDPRVYRAGESAGTQLFSAAKNGGDDFKRAYNAEHARQFNTSSFSDYKAPFPKVVDPMNDPMF
jgi:hypothetical protein